MGGERVRSERTLRIVAGRWRGRKFRFPALDIRPTPDRVRETLFNWHRERVAGAHCLDLFAGSGALGLEALSRGAAEVVFIEQQPAAASAISKLLSAWQGPGTSASGAASVLCLEAEQFLSTHTPRAFDLVFLDPPYGSPALVACARLLERGWLTREARIYVERARRSALPPLPGAWQELRAGCAGEVGYHLFQSGGASAGGSGAGT